MTGLVGFVLFQLVSSKQSVCLHYCIEEIE